jgi:hypothetical protein
MRMPIYTASRMAAMTDMSTPRTHRPRALSRIQALFLALVLIVCGVAIARADRPDPANPPVLGGL